MPHPSQPHRDGWDVILSKQCYPPVHLPTGHLHHFAKRHSRQRPAASPTALRRNARWQLKPSPPIGTLSPAGSAAQPNLGILAISNDPALDAQQKAWARNAWQKTLPYSTGQAYVNYLSEGEDVHTAYNDARFQRLAKIKAQYDPTNLFRFNQNIPPAKP